MYQDIFLIFSTYYFFKSIVDIFCIEPFKTSQYDFLSLRTTNIFVDNKLGRLTENNIMRFVNFYFGGSAGYVL